MTLGQEKLKAYQCLINKRLICQVFPEVHCYASYILF